MRGNQVAVLTRILYSALVVCMGASAVQAQTLDALRDTLSPYQHVGYYTVSWGGIGVGGMVMAAEEDATTYRMTAHIKTDGLAWMFTKHASTSMVEGIKRNGQYLPQTFTSEFMLRGKTRYITLEYDSNGKLKNSTVNPADPAWKRPPVPDALKRDALDALTPFFVQRHAIHTALRNNEETFSIRMFEGRRLTDMDYFITARRNVQWNRRNVPVIILSLSRTPVAGYRDKELKEIRKKQDPQVQLYISDDTRLLPLRIGVNSSAGEFYANLHKTCSTLESCLPLLD